MDPGNERSGPPQAAPVTIYNATEDTVPQAGDSLSDAYRLGVDTLHWTADLPWWEHPALAYLAGLHDGANLERERQAAADDELHRHAVRSALAAMDRADRRASADGGRLVS